MLAHLIPFIFKLCRKESALLNPRHEDMIALPEIELENVFVRDPFQSALRRVDQLAPELGRGEDEDIPVIAFELGEYEQATQFWIGDDQP